MQGFIEILSGIIRLGPETDGYGKPFDIAVAFSSTDGETAVIKALVSDHKLRYSHYATCKRLLAKLELVPDWERFKSDNKLDDGEEYNSGMSGG